MLEPGTKFSCFAFASFPIGDSLPETVEVEPGLWALKRLPFDVESHWKEWLGSLRIDTLRRADFVLLAESQSREPDVYDAENESLTTRVDRLFNGLLLQGVPDYERQGNSLSGANVNGTIQIRHCARLKDPVPTVDIPVFRVAAAEIHRAAELAHTLDRVATGGADWDRLRRGLNALFRGSRGFDGGARLHQFVRALEGLVKPAIAKTKHQFVHRCMTFTGASPEARLALEQMFDIRSHVEHLHSPLSALAGYEHERIAVANQRTRQADVLARFALAHMLESPALLETFRTEPGIDAFWMRRDDQRTGLWGRRCDITQIA